MNAGIRKKMARRKRRIKRRLDKTRFGGECPVIAASSIQYDIAERTRAISAGGIGMIHQMVGKLGLVKAINRQIKLLKLYMPYTESDHILNIAYNLLAGGTRLEHIELRRNDETFLDATGAHRIPDPTTAGDFCRRFDAWNIYLLMEVFNEIRKKVWRQQDESFFEEAIIEADGTMVETYGECKQGIDINYKGQWGYHPLLISLANTGEPLYIVNRPGNRPSHENAAVYLDRAFVRCREAGFKKITARGDTDFSQTEHLDGWDGQGVGFIFGIDATKRLYQEVEKLPESAWKRLIRRPRHEVKTKPRTRPTNVKEQIVVEREFRNIRLRGEDVAEFRYSPSKCNKTYRIVAVRKNLEVTEGRRHLFDDSRCFFYITNNWDDPAEEIVFAANKRCDQENLMAQLKGGVHSLSAPVDNLYSNWAYMVIASLAWSLKAWSALVLPVNGRWKEKHTREKRTLLRMDFATFQNAMINIPAQIIRTGRRIGSCPFSAQHFTRDEALASRVAGFGWRIAA